MEISDHARKRLKERLNDADAEGVFAYLLGSGHPATEEEFKRFRTKPAEGRAYWVGRRKGVLVMVVVDVATDRFVTILRKDCQDGKL